MTALLGLPALAMLSVSLMASASWIERHCFQPWYFLPPGARAATLLRAGAALLGCGLLAVAVLVGRAARRQDPGELGRALGRSALALLLSLCAAEAILRAVERPEVETRNPRLEARLGRPDTRLGWALVPSRTTEVKRWAGGASQERDLEPRIHYAVDAQGNRARTQERVEDPERPTLLIAGESIAFGHGLEYGESVSGLLEDATGMQVVDLAVGGYGSDQAFLRLVKALPRFRHPAAAITFVEPLQLSRNLQDYRPRLALGDGEPVAYTAGGGPPLGAALALAPPAEGFFARLRLRNLWVNELPVMGEARLERALMVTRAVLEESARAARAAGAKPLFVFIDLGLPRPGEPPPAQWLVQSLCGPAALPCVLQPIDRALLFPRDGHPDPRGARLLTETILGALGSARSALSP